jgi:hypothetical protein
LVPISESKIFIKYTPEMLLFLKVKMKTVFLSSLLSAAFAQYAGYYSPPPMNNSTTSPMPEPAPGVPVTVPVSAAPQYYGGYYGSGYALPSYYSGYYGMPNMGYYSPLTANKMAVPAPVPGQPSAQMFSAYYSVPMMGYYGAPVTQPPTDTSTQANLAAGVTPPSRVPSNASTV